MKALNVFVENYKLATQGLTVLGKVFITAVLAFIIMAILFAIVGVVIDALK